MTIQALLPVRYFESIDSTNSEAARLAASGECGPMWLVAREQSKGRGRLDRSWQSPPGGLYATLLLPIFRASARLSDIGFVMSLAVHDALATFITEAKLVLKWPNDCLVGGAKICGVLTETCGIDPIRVAIGCGVNVESAPQGTPYPVTCLQHHNPVAGVAELLAALRRSTENWLSAWQEGLGFDVIRANWQRHSYPPGQAMSVTGSRQVTSGYFVGLAEDGALLLDDDAGKRHILYAGDVQVRAS